ncbi:UDP-glucose 4-epimerase family protein [Pseudomonas helleri]|uniref:UDP-glucose 4-epimerase family protein n=1 Tax=Pseudomonas helleri TaxID=1608996 RepID=UPI003FD644DE
MQGNSLQDKKIFVTGASGFLGSALIEKLASTKNYQVVVPVRREGTEFAEGIEPVLVKTDYLLNGELPLGGVDVVVHCAARVHVMSETISDPLKEFRRINVDGTLRLAEQAALAGVKRFIFISSVKVNGELTTLGKPFTADDEPAPSDPYGISKMEAEQQLRLLGQRTGLEIVIIRPVLVYGPGVRANFRSLMSWVNKGYPLPLGAVRNKRSLVSLGNLVDLIVTCLEHPGAENQTFMVSDDDDMSTTDLLVRMSKALGRRPYLIPVPMSLLLKGSAFLGRRAVGLRLCGSLQVDISKTRNLLDWNPPISVEDALRKSAKSFQESVK